VHICVRGHLQQALEEVAVYIGSLHLLSVVRAYHQFVSITITLREKFKLISTQYHKLQLGYYEQTIFLKNS